MEPSKQTGWVSGFGAPPRAPRLAPAPPPRASLSEDINTLINDIRSARNIDRIKVNMNALFRRIFGDGSARFIRYDDGTNVTIFTFISSIVEKMMDAANRTVAIMRDREPQNARALQDTIIKSPLYLVYKLNATISQEIDMSDLARPNAYTVDEHDQLVLRALSANEKRQDAFDTLNTMQWSIMRIINREIKGNNYDFNRLLNAAHSEFMRDIEMQRRQIAYIKETYKAPS